MEDGAPGISTISANRVQMFVEDHFDLRRAATR